MPKLNGRLPQYRLHRKSGQAIVTLNHRDYYLGPHGTETSKAEYDRLVCQWLAHARQTPPAESAGQSAMSVNKIIHAFWEHAKLYYRKPDGTPAGELDNYRDVLRPLRRLYGVSSALDFGPRALKTVREHLIGLGWCRTHINRQVSRIKSVFRWAVENEMIPAEIHHALIAVVGLKRGRTTARESRPVKPVPEDCIHAIRPFVSRQVWAIIQLQLRTGARAGELVALRGVDLNIGPKVWTVEPELHKTAYLGFVKTIYFGPQAQTIVQEFLRNRPVDACLFSPAEAEAERRAIVHAARKTPLSHGNRPGTHKRSNPTRRPDEAYSVATYRRAIERACDEAFPPPKNLARQRVKGNRGTRSETIKEWENRLGETAWRELKAWQAAHRWHPHQLRHNAATYLRKEFGIEAARVILGQRSPSTTEIYAEIDDEKAKEIVKKIG